MRATIGILLRVAEKSSQNEQKRGRIGSILSVWALVWARRTYAEAHGFRGLRQVRGDEPDVQASLRRGLQAR